MYYYYLYPYMPYYRYFVNQMYNPYIPYSNIPPLNYQYHPYGMELNTYYDDLLPNYTILNNVVIPDYSKVDVGRGNRWPNECFVPYVSVPYNFEKSSMTTNLPYYNLSYVVSENSTTCKPCWNGSLDINDESVIKQIKEIRNMGGDVMVSFGGYANTPIWATAPDSKALRKQYEMFIKAYKLTHINIDIDNKWVRDTASLIRNFRALKQLQESLFVERYSLSIWITLPVLPSGLTSDGLQVVQHALDQDLMIRGYNIKTMNFGKKAAPSIVDKMGQYSIQAAAILHKQLKKIYQDNQFSHSDQQLWGMIGITPMIGVNDVPTEKFYISDAKIVMDFARQNKLGIISMWSLNRDHPCYSGPSETVYGSCSSIEQTDYEFCKLFNDYNHSPDFQTGKGPNRRKSEDIRRWSKDREYVLGDKVTYRGLLFEATRYSKGEAPSKDGSGSWKVLG
ncbi:chitinase [Clostridiaceae bacterium M8S5]|nr:chitinase [Clostridiaceae bacterium M8S5]